MEQRNTFPATDGSSATVIGAGNVELRFLTVESDGGGSSFQAVASRSRGASYSLSCVTVTACRA